MSAMAKQASSELPPENDPLAVFTMDEVGRLLKCSRQQVYVLHQRDGLPFTRLGKRYVVRRGELDRWLSDNTEQAS